MDRLKTIQGKVEYCLEKYPVCRDDDRILIGTVYSLFYDIEPKTITLKEILLRTDLPSFETIRRCRQKLQELKPELRGTKEAKQRRKAQEQRVRAYVKGA